MVTMEAVLSATVAREAEEHVPARKRGRKAIPATATATAILHRCRSLHFMEPNSTRADIASIIPNCECKSGYLTSGTLFIPSVPNATRRRSRTLAVNRIMVFTLAMAAVLLSTLETTTTTTTTKTTIKSRLLLLPCFNGSVANLVRVVNPQKPSPRRQQWGIMVAIIAVMHLAVNPLCIAIHLPLRGGGGLNAPALFLRRLLLPPVVDIPTMATTTTTMMTITPTMMTITTSKQGRGPCPDKCPDPDPCPGQCQGPTITTTTTTT